MLNAFIITGRGIVSRLKTRGRMSTGLVAVLGLMLLVAGCASTKITDRDQVVAGPLPRPNTIWVYDFAATGGRCSGRIRAGGTVFGPRQSAERRADRDRPQGGRRARH